MHLQVPDLKDSLSNFASYLLGDTVPSAEEREERFSRRDGERGEELGEMTAEGSQQAEESKEALEEEEEISSRELEDTLSSRGSESREAWEKGKEKMKEEIQESEAGETWEIGKEIGVGLNEEMTRICRTWDSDNKNSKEAKGEFRGNYKIEVQETWCTVGIELEQGQKIDTIEARECKKEGILAKGYLGTEEFTLEEEGGRKPKAQGKKNQKPSKKEVNVGKAENYWKREETEPAEEQKEEVKEIKPDLEGRAMIAFRVESENGMIGEKEKEDRQAQETEGNVRDWQKGKEGEKAQRMKKGEPKNGQNIEMETKKSQETKKTPDGSVGGGFGKDGKVETPEKQELEKQEVKGAWEAERVGIRYTKKEMEKEAAWEVQGIRPVNINIEELPGVQEPGEITEREDNVKSEVWITSVMEKAEAREVVKSKTAEISPKKEDEEAWKANDMEISREGNMEVIPRGWNTEEAAREDLESMKGEERETEENSFPEQVQTQKTKRGEEMADFWVLGEKEIVKVLELDMEVEGSWDLEEEAGESCENQSEQNGRQDIQETMGWEGTLDNINRSEEMEVKEVMGCWEIESEKPGEVEETERCEESSVTRSKKEVERVKLMREAEVGKSQELGTKDKVSCGTEDIREHQNPEEAGGNWNMEVETGKAQETKTEPRKVQDLMEDEIKGREEEPFRIPERKTLEGCEMEAYIAQHIKNIENGNLQQVKKQDIVVVEGWKIMEGEVEGGQVTEIEDKRSCAGKEVFAPQIREDKGNREAKGSQEFKQQEVPKAEVKTGWGTKETGTTEPEMEEKEVRGDGEKKLEGSQEAQVDRGHNMEESEARNLQEREAMKAKQHWEAGRVIRSQEMNEVEGSQERENKSSRALDREAEEVWEGNAGSPWNTETVNEKAGLNLKEAKARKSQETEQKVKRDWKEIKGVWDSEEEISQKRTGTREDPGSNLLEVEVRKVLGEGNKGFWQVEGTEECPTEGVTERDQVVEESEAGRTWEREEKEFLGDQETGSADVEKSWIVEKEAGNSCEKKKSVFCQGAELQVAMTNREVELVRKEEMKEEQIKSEKKPEGGKENGETEKGVDGDQGVDFESTWPLEEETWYKEETKAGWSHDTEGESSMDNQYLEKLEANGGRKLESKKMEGSDNMEEGDTQDGNREELEFTGCSDTEKAADWGDAYKDSETSGVWESNEKTGRVLEKAEHGQGRRTEEAVDRGSGVLEVSEDRETEATAPTNLIVLRLSPSPNPADEAQSSWNKVPIPSPCLDLSIPKSRVLLSRNASQRRSRPSFRRAPAPKKDDSDDDESPGFLPNEESPVSKLRLIQSEETAVPSPPKPEGTPITARKRPLGHGFGLAHPSMMQELQARLGRPKPE